MAKPGSCLIPVPVRKILQRSDLDRLCLFELDEFVNAWLSQSATSDPENLGALYLVAVNPDGERKASRDRLCCWHPRALALSLKERLFSDEGERAYHRFVQTIKTFRSRAYAKLQAQEEYKRLQEEPDTKQRQFEWEQEQLRKDC